MSRADIIALVKRNTKMEVQTGPFSGLRLHDVQTWGGGEDIGPQLLGVYEEELHPSLLNFVSQRPDVVVNVGCAEGYYAIGLGLLLPDARVFAFDIDLRAQEACRANADLNGIGGRFRVGAECTASHLRDILLQYPNALIVADCEGYEKFLFDSQTSISALLGANIIIELHEFIDRDILGHLTDLFAASHHTSIIQSGPRNPHEFSFLDRSSDADKWLLVCENRPELQRWLVCERRAAPETKIRSLDKGLELDVESQKTAAAFERSDRLFARPYEVDENGKLNPLYRPLVCTITYGPDCYFECLRWFLISLDQFGGYRGKILIISDRERADLIKFVPDSMQERFESLKINNLSHVSRYSICEYLKEDYFPIVYIDNDIVVDSDISPFLKEVIQTDGICVSTEDKFYQELTGRSIGELKDDRRIGNWFGLDLLKADPDCMGEKLPLANSGIIGFGNDYHFKIVSDIVKKLYTHPSNKNIVKYFGDQPLLNYALVKTRLGSYQPLMRKCRFAGTWQSNQLERRGFVHFVWARGEDKSKQMESYVGFLRGDTTSGIAADDASKDTWHRRWQTAQYLSEVGNDEGFARAARTAFLDRPHRAEPLLALARHYLNKSRRDVAAQYADAGLALSLPKQDSTGVDPQVYSTGMREAFTIAASYSQDIATKERGRTICNWLSIARDVTDNVRGLARYNYRWYAEPANKLMPSMVFHPMSVPSPVGYKPGNVSVTRTPGGLVALVRAVNYDLLESGFFDRHGDTSFRQRTILCQLDDQLQLVLSAEVAQPDDMPPPRHLDSLGFEDPRPFMWGEKLWCLSCMRQLNDEGRAEMVLARIDRTSQNQFVLTNWRVLPSGTQPQWEKNWMPQMVDDQLRLVYSVDPTRIITDAGETLFNEAAPAAVENFRGGTQAIPFDGGWLMLIHEWELAGTRRNYFHRFIWLDANTRLSRLTRRFFFRRVASEFAAGLAWHTTGDRLVASFGTDDHDPALAVVEADNVRRVLLPVEEHQKASEQACQAGRTMWERIRQGHEPESHAS